MHVILPDGSQKELPDGASGADLAAAIGAGLARAALAIKVGGEVAHLARPDDGDTVEVRDDEVPVFWACGVTPQAVAAASRPELMITHAPGHMFVTDTAEARQATL